MNDKVPPQQRFGKLIIIKEAKHFVLPSGQTNRAFLCKCDCGNKKVIRWAHLKRGRTTTCGCLVERHGMSKTRLYKTWLSIHNRCAPNYFEKHLYYEKGIRVCSAWKKFIPFKNWALANGYEASLTIDRQNNSKGYSPKNCRWATYIQNVNNRDNTFFVTYNLKKVAFMELIRKKNLLLSQAAIRGRIARGWSPQKAIDTAIRLGNYKRRCT